MEIPCAWTGLDGKDALGMVISPCSELWLYNVVYIIEYISEIMLYIYIIYNDVVVYTHI